jgi:hypothetical protein
MICEVVSGQVEVRLQGLTRPRWNALAL